jgi:hypothetical protein
MPDDPEVDLSEIYFRAPKRVADYNAAKFYADGSTSNPFFDYQKGEIVWTTYVDGPDEYGYNVRKLDIWHIGTRFTLDLLDPIDFKSCAQPTLLVLDGDSLNFNFTEDSKSTKTYTPPTVRCLLEDNKWVSLPVNVLPNVTVDKAYETRESLLLFRDKDPSMNYVYLIRYAYHHNFKTISLFLDLIKMSLFREMNPKRPSLWQTVQVPYNPTENVSSPHGLWQPTSAVPFGQLITTDISTGKRRFYIFSRSDRDV